MNSFSLIGDMVAYWRRPVFTRDREPLTPGGVVALMGLVALVILGLLPVSLIVGTLMAATGSEVPGLSEDAQAAMNSGSFVMLAVIIAPLLEEVIFRGWMGFRAGSSCRSASF